MEVSTVFERLFKRQSTIKRHQQGPLAEERGRYLAFKAEGGTSQSTLLWTADYLLAIASRMDLASTASTSMREIEEAAASWAQRRPRKNPRDTVQGRQKAFKSVACSWLRFLNRLTLPEVPPDPYEQNISEFAEYMEKERGLSPRTIAGRCWNVRKFLKRLQFQGALICRIDPKTVGESLAWQARQGYTRRGMQTFADSVRTYFKYAEMRSWCPAGIATGISIPRAFREERLPSGPSWDDVQRLLSFVDTNDSTDIRDRAILMLLAIYGLRLDEVRRLQLEDIDWHREVIVIRHSKQGRARTYPLIQSVGDAILRYFKEVRPRTNDRAVFIRMKAPHRSLGAGGLWPVVGRRIRRLGIVVPHPGPHCLRHACAARLLARGLSFKEIGDHLGHESAESTRIYAKVDLASLRKVGNLDLGGLL